MAQSQHPHSGQAGRQSRDREMGAPSWGRERPSSPSRKLTNNTQEQKDPGPHGGSPPGSGGKGGELRLCPPSLPCPPLAPQGWGCGRPPLSASPSLATPCPLLTWRLCLLETPGGCCSVGLSVPLSPVWLPACLSRHLPVRAPTVHLASQPPVILPHLSPSFCLSVPDWQLTQLLTLFVPAHSASWWREGDTEDTGRRHRRGTL